MKLAAMGECMIEVATTDRRQAHFGFGGDTYNFAVYLARCMGSDHDIRYVSALGDDELSAHMLNTWQTQGLSTDLVFRLKDRLPGLYVITTDAGERAFHYWREQAAVRFLFNDERTAVLHRTLQGTDLIYFSGITLAILDAPSLDRLERLLSDLRRTGTKIAFDPNYRPRLWAPSDALATMARFVSLIDIALPGMDDHRMLEPKATRDDVAAYYQDGGVHEVVIRDGENAILTITNRDTIEIETAPVTPVDTTAAGDSFNAAYVAARMLGRDVTQAVHAGQRLAAQVVQAHGAIMSDIDS
ncbi:MAG: sugar kinase [Pseudomonadota bacterium]